MSFISRLFSRRGLQETLNRPSARVLIVVNLSLIGGEYRRTHASTLMTRPYGRIIALHITIIFGAMLTMILGSPLGLLIVLVIMKTGADLALHQVERQKLGTL